MTRLIRILLLLPLLVGTLVHAQGEVMDRIVAIVDDEAIYASDLDDIVRQVMFQQGKTSASQAEVAQIRREALQSLIKDKLIIAQAKRLDIDIPFKEVETRVDDAIDENRRMLGGAEAFDQQLAREGFSEKSLRELYRSQIKNRLLVEQVLASEMAKTKREPTETELRELYTTRTNEIPMRPAVVHLNTIFIGFETSSTASTVSRQRIDEAHARLLRGERFADVARDLSDDPSATNGGDLGFINPKDLADPKLSETVSGMSIGEISEPVLTSYGWHVLLVSERDSDTGNVRLSHVLVRVTATESDVNEVFQTANTIYKELQAGAPFDSLANRFSTDPSAGPGGDLGWLKLEDLPEFFRSILMSMHPGEISQVLREAQGFRIIRLVARETQRPYEFEEVRAELRRLWQGEQAAEVYEAYVENLRGKFTVDVKVATF